MKYCLSLTSSHWKPLWPFTEFHLESFAPVEKLHSEKNNCLWQVSELQSSIPQQRDIPELLRASGCTESHSSSKEEHTHKTFPEHHSIVLKLFLAGPAAGALHPCIPALSLGLVLSITSRWDAVAMLHDLGWSFWAAPRSCPATAFITSLMWVL